MPTISPAPKETRELLKRPSVEKLKLLASAALTTVNLSKLSKFISSGSFGEENLSKSNNLFEPMMKLSLLNVRNYVGNLFRRRFRSHFRRKTGESRRHEFPSSFSLVPPKSQEISAKRQNDFVLRLFVCLSCKVNKFNENQVYRSNIILLLK
jgi:hypothetical protein